MLPNYAYKQLLLFAFSENFHSGIQKLNVQSCE